MLTYSLMQSLNENIIDNYAYNTWQEELKTINEATYYGKNKKLLEVEHILDEMVKIGKTKGGVTSQKFNDKMEEVANKLGSIFGFYSFQINNSILLFTPSILDILTNPGSTLCKSAIYKYTKRIIDGQPTYVIDLDKNHQGVRFKANSRYTMRMFLNINLFKPSNEYSFTGGQILAIILHEIGHNFYVGPVKEVGIEFVYMLTAGDLIAYVKTLIEVSLIGDLASNIIDSNMPPIIRKSIANIVGWIENIIEIPTNLIGMGLKVDGLISNLTTISGLIAGTLVLKGSLVALSFLKYDSEKYSDAFATSYGYGVELAQALDNMDHRSLYRAQTYIGQDIHDILFTLYRIPIEVIDCVTDEHPNTQGRLKNDIDYLEACGKDIKNPKLRKEYEENMKEMYALRDSVKNYNGGNPIKVSNRIRALIQDMINISDVKDLTTSLRPKYAKYTNIDM